MNSTITSPSVGERMTGRSPLRSFVHFAAAHRGGLIALLFCVLLCPTGTAGEKGPYQLVGQIVQEREKHFRGVTPLVILYSTAEPFTTKTLADLTGRFKIKNLFPGVYNLIIAVPYAGECRRTVEIGPSFADEKKRVVTSILFVRNNTEEHSVSTVELSIPESAASCYRKAQEYLSKHEVQAAVDQLQKAIRLAPQFSAAWNNLGTIAFQSGRFTEAETHFRKALDSAPNAYAPLVNLGAALLSEGRYDEAFPVNSSAVRVKPDDPLAQSQLGNNLYRLGRLDEAEDHLKQAEALDPSHFSYPQLVLAQIYESRGNHSMMMHELEEFLKLHPDSAQAAGVLERLRSTGMHEWIQSRTTE